MEGEGQSAAQRAANRTLVAVDFYPDGGADVTVEREQMIDRLFADLVDSESVLRKLCEIKATVAYAEARGQDPLTVVELGFVFAGPPGTGKTTVARRMGAFYEMLGLLPSAEVVQCTATDLITGYAGQAGKQTRKIFESARGKVLFIDEAYRLDPRKGEAFVQQSVDEMVNLLTEDEFKGKMLVILAGYEDEMEEMLQVAELEIQTLSSTHCSARRAG